MITAALRTSPPPAALAPTPPCVREAPPATLPVSTLLALGLAGFCAFLNVYATQPLLPLVKAAFGVSTAEAALTVSAPTIAIALASPFIGALAHRYGRRRLMVLALFALSAPTMLAATSGGIGQLLAWRFAQGLFVPGIYAVGLAYIAEACDGVGVGQAIAALITGNVVGGFAGRVVSGLTAEHVGWRASFLALGLLTLAGAAATGRWLPREARKGTRRAPANPVATIRALGRKLVTTPLLATYAVGFNVLFSLVALFTYVTFHLAAPPYELGAAALSWLFVVYLVGAVVTPLAGNAIDRFGPRRVIAAALGAGMAGGVLTLSRPLWAIGVGLALSCTAAFICQSAATSFLQGAAAPESRSTASGIYVSTYYLGGSAGGILPAAAWHAGGWAACVALAAAVQLATVALAFRFWRSPALRTETPERRDLDADGSGAYS